MRIDNISKQVQFKSQNIENINSSSSIDGGLSSIKVKFADILSSIDSNWTGLSSRLGALHKSLDPKNRVLLESQLISQQLGIQTELLSRVAESASSLAKRVQQLGS